MSSFDYVIMPFQGLLLHDTDVSAVLADSDDSNPELDAHVRSGDYFATLATTLDELSQRLNEANEAEAAALQKLINDLLYIERRYKLGPRQDRR